MPNVKKVNCAVGDNLKLAIQLAFDTQPPTCQFECNDGYDVKMPFIPNNATTLAQGFYCYDGSGKREWRPSPELFTIYKRAKWEPSEIWGCVKRPQTSSPSSAEYTMPPTSYFYPTNQPEVLASTNDNAIISETVIIMMAVLLPVVILVLFFFVCVWSLNQQKN